MDTLDKHEYFSTFFLNDSTNINMIVEMIVEVVETISLFEKLFLNNKQKLLNILNISLLQLN